MASVRTCLAASLALVASACGMVRDQTNPNVVSVRGIPPTLEQLNITSLSTVQGGGAALVPQVSHSLNAPLTYGIQFQVRFR